MITLCMDTSYDDLVLAIIKDNQVLDSIQKECKKRQSEEVFPCLEELMNRCNLEPKDIDDVVVTKGPGSYTGIRIAMSIAKVLCKVADKNLYTIDTLKLYAGKEDNALVLKDARGDRAYCLFVEDGKKKDSEIKDIEELKSVDLPILGDGHLIGKQDIPIDIVNSFLVTKDEWEKVDNIDLVEPTYLKSIEAYKVK